MILPSAAVAPPNPPECRAISDPHHGSRALVRAEDEDVDAHDPLTVMTRPGQKMRR